MMYVSSLFLVLFSFQTAHSKGITNTKGIRRSPLLPPLVAAGSCLLLPLETSWFLALHSHGL